MYEITIGCKLRQLNAYLTQYGKKSMDKMKLTPAQSMLLEYLLLGRKDEYYLTDICAELGLAKATVSVMLKTLRSNGYLEVKLCSGDDRRRKVVLTDKAFQVQQEIEERIKDRGECVFRGITEEELKVMEGTLDKMISNLRETT